MKNELTGIYEHIGPSKFDSKITVHPQEIEEFTKAFGEWIAMWYKEYQEYKETNPSYAVSAFGRMRQAQQDLVKTLRWLGGDD